MDTWQLVINTGSTIIPFLMVLLFSKSRKDTTGLQVKLNELISATKPASNRLISIEDLTEDEMEILKKFYVNLSALAQRDKEMDIRKTHSPEEAAHNHYSKQTPQDK